MPGAQSPRGGSPMPADPGIAVSANHPLGSGGAARPIHRSTGSIGGTLTPQPAPGYSVGVSVRISFSRLRLARFGRVAEEESK